VTPGERKQLYEAESPDELALIDAACVYNIRLMQRSSHHVTVSLAGPSSSLANCISSNRYQDAIIEAFL